MTNSSVIGSTAQIYGVQPAKVKIQNGSQVNVKIIFGDGNGKYTATVAGVRVNIRSERVFESGEIFKAKLFVKDGTVFLTPIAENKSGIQIENFPLSVVSDFQVFDFFKNLGLPSDFAMLNIFQMMKQLQMKLNIPLFTKLHNIAVKFNGKQKTAAEILMILADKGFDFNEEDIFSLLKLVDNQIDYKEKNNEQNENAKKVLNKINLKNGGWFIIPFCIENLFENNFVAETEFFNKIAENDAENDDKKKNIFFDNKVLSEISDEKPENIIGFGNIRILIGNEQKIKLLNLSCNFQNKNYYFSLEHKNGICKKIKMNIDDENLENNHKILLKLQDKIDKLFLSGKIKSKTEIEWGSKSELDGFSCENEEFYSINQKI